MAMNPPRSTVAEEPPAHLAFRFRIVFVRVLVPVCVYVCVCMCVCRFMCMCMCMCMRMCARVRTSEFEWWWGSTFERGVAPGRALRGHAHRFHDELRLCHRGRRRRVLHLWRNRWTVK